MIEQGKEEVAGIAHQPYTTDCGLCSGRPGAKGDRIMRLLSIRLIKNN